MLERKLKIENIPAVVYGDASGKAYLFVHGQCGRKEEGLAFAEVACSAGYQVLAVDLPEHGERQGEKTRLNPWTVVPELKMVSAYMKSQWDEIGVHANSIGAHFSMLAFDDKALRRALFVSPIVDMEQLIAGMMRGAGVTKQELQSKGEITTDFGQTLSWEYLSWEQQHPIQSWSCPTAILYGEQDDMTSRETVEQFAAAHGAALSVMKNGEHWFHTPEQLVVLRAWERENI